MKDGGGIMRVVVWVVVALVILKHVAKDNKNKWAINIPKHIARCSGRILVASKQGRNKEEKEEHYVHQVGHGLVGNVHVQRAHATTTITSAERYATTILYHAVHTQTHTRILWYSKLLIIFIFFLFISFFFWGGGLFPFHIRFLREEEEKKGEVAWAWQ